MRYKWRMCRDSDPGLRSDSPLYWTDYTTHPQYAEAGIRTQGAEAQ